MPHLNFNLALLGLGKTLLDLLLHSSHLVLANKVSLLRKLVPNVQRQCRPCPESRLTARRRHTRHPSLSQKLKEPQGYGTKRLGTPCRRANFTLLDYRPYKPG